MSKKSHQILDSLIQNIENNVTDFISSSTKKTQTVKRFDISKLTRDQLLHLMNSSDTYSFESIGTVNEIVCVEKLPKDVFENKVTSLENIRIAQIQLIEKLKEAKRAQISLYKMMSDFKYGDQ